jgi:hypothetical protein
MARKRRKLFGAALAAHQKKLAHRNPSRRRRHRRNPARRHARRASVVVVNRTRRHRRHRRYTSNPLFPRPSGALQSAVNVGSLVAVFFAALTASAWANNKAQMSVGWMNESENKNLIGKALLAALGVLAVRKFVKNPNYKAVAYVGVAAPLGVQLVEKFAPQIGNMIPLLSSAPAPAPKAAAGAAPKALSLGASLNANLQARLNAELEEDRTFVTGY